MTGCICVAVLINTRLEWFYPLRNLAECMQKIKEHCLLESIFGLPESLFSLFLIHPVKHVRRDLSLFCALLFLQ